MMKRLFNIVVCACALLVASCANDSNIQNANDNTPSDDKGVLVLNVGTRTNDGTTYDYILSIYKNEEGKSTLVRKYDSSKSDMQKPEYIWLLEGNYTATVESGKAVSATFNEAEQYYYGQESFNIKGGETSTVDLVAAKQNISVEVVFDQSIIEGKQGKFIEGYNVEVKADNKVKLTYTESKKGYIIMPEGNTTLTWRFVGTYRYEDGEQVSVDKSGALENVEPKRAYKLSFKFSPDANGLLGGLEVVVDDTVEERDDHIAFSPDPELKGVGFDINTHCNYVGGDRQYIATALAEFVGITLTANGKVYDPVNSQVAGVTYTGLNTSQLYITLSEEFFYSLNGGEQFIELCVTDAGNSHARKDLPYTLPGVNVYNNSAEKIAWTGCSSAISATVFGTPSSVELLYREGEGEWKSYTASASGTNTYSAAIDGLAPGHTYEYTLTIDGKYVGGSRTFTTRDGNQIPNGDMETWSANKNPFADANSKYWDTGNEGSSMAGTVLTTRNEDTRPGSKGRYSAYLNSEVASVMGISKFAAGNIFVGYFGETIINLSNPGATVFFGQPFSYNAKPKGVKMWVKYNCGIINNVGGGGGAKGEPDLTKIFCCMCNWTQAWCVDSTKAAETTFSPSMSDIKSCTDGRYDGVLYTAYFESKTSNDKWHELYIPFEKVEGTNENTIPNFLVLTASCSGYGDYFTGSSDSWMYIDDIELVY